MEEKAKTLFLYYFRLLGLYILFFIALAIVKELYPDLFLENYNQDFLQELLDENPFKLFVLAVIVAPIIEEMMFRTALKPTHSELILFVCSWPVFYLNRYIPLDVHWAIKLAFTAVILFTLHYILKQLIAPARSLRTRLLLSKYDSTVLVLTSLVFGFVHIYNYVDDFYVNAALFALIVPRIISGFMLGLIKIKNEYLIWSISLHAVNNGVVVLILILTR